MLTIKEIVGKGFGYIATEDIQEDTILFEEKPMILANERFGKYAYDEILYVICKVLEDENILMKFNILAPQKINDLHIDIHVEQFIKELKKYNTNLKKNILTKINFNQFMLLCYKYKRNVFAYKNKISAILEKGSLFNHSCKPNCIFYYENDKMIFKTDTLIKKGDELCISYINVDQNKDKRQEELYIGYGFKCNCQLCI
jgi:hypothetical protein